jgi:hypothetical protein
VNGTDATVALAQEQPLATAAPVDTTKDTDTGHPRNGVSVGYDEHSVSVGGSVSGKEIER